LTGDADGSAYVENITGCISLGYLLGRLLFHFMYEGNIYRLFLLGRRLGRFNLPGQVTLPFMTGQQYTYFAFHALHLLFAFQDLIEPAHAGGANTRSSECHVDLVLPLLLR
jgi:hypothetical protein